MNYTHLIQAIENTRSFRVYQDPKLRWDVTMDIDPRRYHAHLSGMWHIDHPSPVVQEFRLLIQYTDWNDGITYVQFQIIDCEGDFVSPMAEPLDAFDFRTTNYKRPL